MPGTLCYADAVLTENNLVTTVELAHHMRVMDVPDYYDVDMDRK